MDRRKAPFQRVSEAMESRLITLALRFQGRRNQFIRGSQEVAYQAGNELSLFCDSKIPELLQHIVLKF